VGRRVNARNHWTRANLIHTHGNVIGAHLAHLKHLAKPATCELILRNRFNRPSGKARLEARLIAAHVARAVDFISASKSCGDRLQPLLQYYCYLNLAVAVVLAYRPPNHLGYRRHGVTDLTGDLTQIDLASSVAQVTRGALTLFHSVVSDAPLPQGPLRLRTLLAAIPMLSAEMNDAFGLVPSVILVREGVELSASGTGRQCFSHITFQIAVDGKQTEQPMLSRATLEAAMPILRTAYSSVASNKGILNYRSRHSWDEASKSEAVEAHRKYMLKCINYGGHVVTERVHPQFGMYRWYFVKRSLMLPTSTASLLFASCLASLVRYRPALTEKLEGSRLNILRETFVNEADGYLIPMFRNLLFREELAIQSLGIA
jgi:hypothetical protein